MGKASQLNAGLVCDDGIYDEVVKEILNHQGILFKEIHRTEGERLKFPCTILARRTDEGYAMAKEHCDDENNVVVIEEEIPLNIVLKAFGGVPERSLSDPLNPVVNKLEVDLLTKIKEKYFSQNLPIARKWFWPGFSKACCVLTHDIDWLYYSPWHFAAMRNKSVFQLIKLFYQSIVHKRNYGNNIPEIIMKEKQRNMRSSFYFMSGYEYEYHEEFLRLLKTLKDEKIEIGLHGTRSSHKDMDFLRKQKSILEEHAKTDIVGLRHHHLKFLVPLTWRYQQETGFRYDMTFFSNYAFGFRGGTCFPYHPIDVNKNGKFSLLEIPTSFDDWNALHNRMSYKECLSMVAKIIEVVERFNGCLAVNFHNTYQNKETFPEMERLYSDVLDTVNNQNYRVMTAKECCSWWLKREKTKVDMAIKNDLIKGKTSSYPIPIVIETPDGKKIHVNLQKTDLSINLAK